MKTLFYRIFQLHRQRIQAQAEATQEHRAPIRRRAFGSAIKLGLLAALASFSPFSFAANFYYSTEKDALNACTAFIDGIKGNWKSPSYTRCDVVGAGSAGTVSAQGTQTANGGSFYTINTYMWKTNCAAGTSPNISTGVCEKPPSSCKQFEGQQVSWGFSIPGYVSSEGKHGLGEYVSLNQCRVTITTFECKPAKDGSDVGYCVGLGTYTGDDSAAGDKSVGDGAAGTDPTTAPEPEPEPEDPKDPEDPSTNCPVGYSWSGTTCVPTDPKDPAEPSDPKDPETPGGGGSGGGSDSGSGGTGDGSDGGGTGGGGTGGGGSGDGDGDGKGEGDEEEEGDEPHRVEGTDCKAALICRGDAITCAILAQEKKSYCELQDNMDVNKGLDKVKNDITADKYQLDEEEVDVSGFFETGTRWLPATCPADPVMNFARASISLPMELPCWAATQLGYVLVAFGGIFFIVYVGRSFGGE